MGGRVVGGVLEVNPSMGVKNNFRGAVVSVDMDRLCYIPEVYNSGYLMKEQAELMKLRKGAKSSIYLLNLDLSAQSPPI